MARKKAEVVEEKITPEKKAPKKVMMDKVVADKYVAISVIRCVDKVYRPGDIVEFPPTEIKRLRKDNAIELVKD